MTQHDDVIKWKHFPRYWPFVRGIHRSPVNSQHKGQWRGALIFSLICDWINGWANNREADDLRRYRAHYDVTVMVYSSPYAPVHSSLLKGLRMVARALWRSEARRVVPWLRPCTRLRLVQGLLGRRPCTSRRRVQGRSQGTTLSASDLHNARATILNPFYNMESKIIKKIWHESERTFQA